MIVKLMVAVTMMLIDNVGDNNWGYRDVKRNRTMLMMTTKTTIITMTMTTTVMLVEVVRIMITITLTTMIMVMMTTMMILILTVNNHCCREPTIVEIGYQPHGVCVFLTIRHVQQHQRGRSGLWRTRCLILGPKFFRTVSKSSIPPLYSHTCFCCITGYSPKESEGSYAFVYGKTVRPDEWYSTAVHTFHYNCVTFRWACNSECF